MRANSPSCDGTPYKVFVHDITYLDPSIYEPQVFLITSNTREVVSQQLPPYKDKEELRCKSEYKGTDKFMVNKYNPLLRLLYLTENTIEVVPL